MTSIRILAESNTETKTLHTEFITALWDQDLGNNALNLCEAKETTCQLHHVTEQHATKNKIKYSSYHMMKR